MNDWWVWVCMFLLHRRWWYRNMYLRSTHWRDIRSVKLIKSGFRCSKCGVPMWRSLDVHHLTYKNIWHEKLEDLQVLCRECHQKEHHVSQSKSASSKRKQYLAGVSRKNHQRSHWGTKFNH